MKFFLIGFFITLSLLWPLFAAPYFTHHDDVQNFRLYEMDKCVKDGQFPCRWVPDMGGKFGYPLFNYYGPLPYYVGEVFYLLTHDLMFSTKVMFAIAFIGAYLFMYLLGRRYWGEAGGALSGILYSLAPYHAVDFYVRGAMGEMWSLMFFPAILWALFALKESLKVAHSLRLGLFLALLITSHNISTMIFLPILVGLSLLVVINERFRRTEIRLLQLLGLSLLMGLLLSAFYWIPMLLEKNLVHVETTAVGYFSYTEHFKGLKKLIVDRSWGWGTSVREVPGGEKDGMSFQIGWVHLIFWLISLYGAYRLWSTRRQLSYLIVFSSVVAALSIFMIHPRSEFIWKLLDPLKYVQFPWRFLMMIILFVSFSAGSILSLVNRRTKILLWFAAVILAFAFNFSYFKPGKFLWISQRDLLSGDMWDRQLRRSIYDFLPIYAKEPPADIASVRYQILTGQTEVIDFREGSNWIAFNTNTKTHSIIRLSQYYFPEWRIFIDGKRANVDYSNNQFGLMTFILGPGNHRVEAKLADTTARTLSDDATILGVLLFLVLIISQIGTTRKWFSYYLRALYR